MALNKQRFSYSFSSFTTFSCQNQKRPKKVFPCVHIFIENRQNFNLFSAIHFSVWSCVPPLLYFCPGLDPLIQVDPLQPFFLFLFFFHMFFRRQKRGFHVGGKDMEKMSNLFFLSLHFFFRFPLKLLFKMNCLGEKNLAEMKIKAINKWR